MRSVSAVIICFENWGLIEHCTKSLFNQTYPIAEIIIIDDCSPSFPTQPSNIINDSRVVFFKNDRNMGRGYCRKLGILKSKHEYVFFCDATNIAPPFFLNKALDSLLGNNIASIGGRILNDPNCNFFAKSWRARHLFKSEHNYGMLVHDACSLNTYGLLMKKEIVLKIGNFNSNLRHSEDKELGQRLKDEGYRILGDPNLYVYSMKIDSVISVLERYWRWYGGTKEKMSLIDYLHSIKSSIRLMIPQDLNQGDWRSALISFICPHYGYLRYLVRKIIGKLQVKN